jgi:hypothetical protein
LVNSKQINEKHQYNIDATSLAAVLVQSGYTKIMASHFLDEIVIWHPNTKPIGDAKTLVFSYSLEITITDTSRE